MYRIWSFNFILCLTGCGRTYPSILTNGVVTSSNYPNALNFSAQCEYRINIPRGQILEVNITNIELGNFGTTRSAACPSNYLEVSHYMNEWVLFSLFMKNFILWSILNSVQNHTQYVLVCSTSVLLVSSTRTFHCYSWISDNDVQNGWLAEQQRFSLRMEIGFWRFTKGNNDRSNPRVFWECGGEFHAPSGTIRSPRYPLNYRNGMFCRYDITAQRAVISLATYLIYIIQLALTDWRNTCHFPIVFSWRTKSLWIWLFGVL